MKSFNDTFADVAEAQAATNELIPIRGWQVIYTECPSTVVWMKKADPDAEQHIN
jgi:hypothetical protein